MSTEVRTPGHIMAGLLQFALDGEWSDQHNTACGCHPEYTPCCPECGALKYNPQGGEGKHEAGCKRMALIEEGRAYLRVENTLAEEQGRFDDEVSIP